MREIYVHVFILEIFFNNNISSTVLTITLSIIIQLLTNVHHTETEHLLNYQDFILICHKYHSCYAYIGPLPIIVIVLVPIRYLYLLGNFSSFNSSLNSFWNKQVNSRNIYIFGPHMYMYKITQVFSYKN